MKKKNELKRNPFYVKLLDEFNCLKNKHEIIKSENLKNMKRANEFSKRNKELIEELNKLNYYNDSPLRGSE